MLDAGIVGMPDDPVRHISRLFRRKVGGGMRVVPHVPAEPLQIWSASVVVKVAA